MSLNRQAIRDRFRQENPEAVDRVIADTVLNSWINEGNKEFSTDAGCIVQEFTATTTLDQRNYELTDLTPKFYEIDDVSGGVWYNNKYLTPTSLSALSASYPRWKQNLAGEPKQWYRRGNTLWLDKNPLASKTLEVSCILLPDDLTDDTSIPFDGLTYLAPFHYALVVYLQWKFKIKMGKDQEALTARAEYEIYVGKCKNLISSNRFSSVAMQPRINGYQPSARNRR